MRVLINALSATNQSGKHVLIGHLTQLIKWTADKHSYVLLYNKSNNDLHSKFGKEVEWILCPDYTKYPPCRCLWEFLVLPHLATRLKVDFLFTPSGMIIPSISIPQVSLAQNPRPFIPWLGRTVFRRSPYRFIKDFLAVRGFKIAMRKAVVMIFNSEYMRQLYRKRTGLLEKESIIACQAINDDTHLAGKNMHQTINKKPFQILCVSDMIFYKGVETIVQAVDKLKKHNKIPAKLYLVGRWRDAGYERKIRRLVAKLNLDKDIFFTGYVSRDILYKYYAESKVFCLMSWCESFGIPAIEAQAFGTPVVSSNFCAIPEICGKGGIYPEPEDVEGVTVALAKMLTDIKYWKEMSDAALDNASKYKWEICSRPLLRMFDVITLKRRG
jgi:glycosyltransferase involved in cell wall biosynthesis